MMTMNASSPEPNQPANIENDVNEAPDFSLASLRQAVGKLELLTAEGTLLPFHIHGIEPATSTSNPHQAKATPSTPSLVLDDEEALQKHAFTVFNDYLNPLKPQHHLDALRQQLQRSQEFLPQSITVLTALGWCHAMLGHVVKARTCIFKALVLHQTPSNSRPEAGLPSKLSPAELPPLLASAYAWLLMREGVFQQAHQAFKTVPWGALPLRLRSLGLAWANLCQQQAKRLGVAPPDQGWFKREPQTSTPSNAWGGAFSVAFWHYVGRPCLQQVLLFKEYPLLIQLLWNECLVLPQAELAKRSNQLQQQLCYPQIAIVASQHYSANRDLVNAAKQLKRSLKRFPHHTDTLVHLGKLYVSTNKLLKAIQTFQHCLEQEPCNAAAHYELAQLHHDLKNEKLAVEHYVLAYVYGEQGSFRRTAAFALTVLLETHEEIANDTALILSLLLKLEQETTKTAATLSHLARVCNQAHLMVAALVFSRLAVQASEENVQCQVNLGYSCWIDGKPHEAIVHYRQALALDAQNTFALNNLGALYLDELHDVEAALPLFYAALETNPNYALAYYNIGRAYSLQQQSTQAAMAFSKARTLNSVTHELDEDEINQRMNELYKQL